MQEWWSHRVIHGGRTEKSCIVGAINHERFRLGSRWHRRGTPMTNGLGACAGFLASSKQSKQDMQTLAGRQAAHQSVKETCADKASSPGQLGRGRVRELRHCAKEPSSLRRDRVMRQFQQREAW